MLLPSETTLGNNRLWLPVTGLQWFMCFVLFCFFLSPFSFLFFLKHFKGTVVFQKAGGCAGGKCENAVLAGLFRVRAVEDAYGAEVQTAVHAGHQVEWWSSRVQAIHLEGHSRDHLIGVCTSEGQPERSRFTRGHFIILSKITQKKLDPLRWN